ncbi:hypothetical protein CLAIMM_03547 [Cladophialophora immunda]|nr:hypothetical protein CLAIMM_03547 [Cladophialophora immunda]
MLEYPSVAPPTTSRFVLLGYLKHPVLLNRLSCSRGVRFTSLLYLTEPTVVLLSSCTHVAISPPPLTLSRFEDLASSPVQNLTLLP